MLLSRSAASLAAALALVPLAGAQNAFVPFESPQTHPVQVSPDGTRLAVVHSSDQRVGIYSLGDPSNPVLLREIAVGLEPVSLRFRSDDELWVVNWLSDSVSVISLAQGQVVATLEVGDEPADVVFAGTPERAFVSATAKDQIHVFDAASRASLALIPFPSKDPRALAASGDRTKVLALSARSGNGTTVVPKALAPAPPPPTNPLLPPAPQQGILVAASDPAWTSAHQTILPDEDLFEIDAQSFAITRRVTAVGTTNFDLAVHPVSGEVFIANLESRNLVRFENALRGHAVDSRVTRVAANGAKSFFDLNPTVSYATLPDPASAAVALAEPTGLALDAAAGKLYVAAQGTDRIGVLDTNGTLLGRIELGVAGAASNARTKKGPRGLALHPSASRLYVVQRMAASLAVIDTATQAVLRELPFAHDPTPAQIKAGRGFLYDAKLAGNGTFSCAACHIDADLDGLAWDLGNPGANQDPAPVGQPFPFNLLLQPFHPMKGPMTTQTLRGLRGEKPFHWRGDRIDFENFNGTFDALMGGSVIPAGDMADFKAFMLEVVFPPNPNQLRSRSYATTPSATNQAAGLDTFRNFSIGSTPIGTLTCATCHALPTGSNHQVINPQLIAGQIEIQMKVPHLRNLYRKVGYRKGVPSKLGFGFIHDGTIDTLASFLAIPAFNSWPSNRKDDLEQFLLAFDTGTAPAVGWQRALDASNASSTGLAADLALLEAQAAARNCDLVAKGRLDGEDLGLHYEQAGNRYRASRAALGTFTRAELLAQAQSGRATWIFTGVPVGSGRRMGIDRDADNALDGDEGLVAYGAGTPSCGIALRANAEPRLGFTGFAFAVEGAPAITPGALLLSLARANVPLLGVNLLVDPFSPGLFSFPIGSDARGVAVAPFPISADPLLIGLTLDFQALFPAACGPQGLAASQGLEVTVQP
ncbi:MAG: hypothetical protein JNM84_24090 [Planctomycetes bacterium]|nr:hypothetical protein [Planctomycetota bacterium]